MVEIFPENVSNGCLQFAKMYVAEIKNLDRILESLVRSGMIPSGFSVPSTAVSALTGSISVLMR